MLASSGAREGPFTIATPPSAGKCILSLETGGTVEDGKEIDIGRLEAA